MAPWVGAQGQVTSAKNDRKHAPITTSSKTWIKKNLIYKTFRIRERIWTAL